MKNPRFSDTLKQFVFSLTWYRRKCSEKVWDFCYICCLLILYMSFTSCNCETHRWYQSTQLRNKWYTTSFILHVITLPIKWLCAMISTLYLSAMRIFPFLLREHRKTQIELRIHRVLIIVWYIYVYTGGRMDYSAHARKHTFTLKYVHTYKVFYMIYMSKYLRLYTCALAIIYVRLILQKSFRN